MLENQNQKEKPKKRRKLLSPIRVESQNDRKLMKIMELHPRTTGVTKKAMIEHMMKKAIEGDYDVLKEEPTKYVRVNVEKDLFKEFQDVASEMNTNVTDLINKIVEYENIKQVLNRGKFNKEEYRKYFNEIGIGTVDEIKEEEYQEKLEEQRQRELEEQRQQELEESRDIQDDEQEIQNDSRMDRPTND